VLGIVGATIGLVLASWVLPGFNLSGWEDALRTAVLVAVIGSVLRVLLVEGAIRLGWVGSILLGLLGQALAVWLVVYAPKGLDAADLGWALLASWIVAFVSTFLVWFATAGTDDAVTASLLRRARRRRVTLDDPDDVATSDLPAAADQALFRIAQEAVTNALKHAPGSPVTVRLVRDGSAVVLEVRDVGAPGSAPPVEAPLSAGTGLLTMRERADGLGGTFDAGPAATDGWVVRAAVPVAERPTEEESA